MEQGFENELLTYATPFCLVHHPCCIMGAVLLVLVGGLEGMEAGRKEPTLSIDSLQVFRMYDRVGPHNRFDPVL